MRNCTQLTIVCLSSGRRDEVQTACPGPAARGGSSSLRPVPCRAWEFSPWAQTAATSSLWAWKVLSISPVGGHIMDPLRDGLRSFEYGFHFISFHTSLSSQEETSFLGAPINSSVSLARTRHLPTSRPIPGKGEDTCQAGLHHS